MLAGLTKYIMSNIVFISIFTSISLIIFPIIVWKSSISLLFGNKESYKNRI